MFIKSVQVRDPTIEWSMVNVQCLKVVDAQSGMTDWAPYVVSENQCNTLQSGVTNAICGLESGAFLVREHVHVVSRYVENNRLQLMVFVSTLRTMLHLSCVLHAACFVLRFLHGVCLCVFFLGGTCLCSDICVDNLGHNMFYVYITRTMMAIANASRVHALVMAAAQKAHTSRMTSRMTSQMLTPGMQFSIGMQCRI